MVIPLKNKAFSKNDEWIKKNCGPLEKFTVSFKKPVVLVTGSDGFIGSHLCKLLLDKGYDVYGIDNHSVGKRRYEGCLDIDICNYPAVLKIFEEIRPDYVFHLAAFARIQPSIDDPVLWITNNVNSTINVLEASRITKVKKVVFSSSSSVYGDNKIPFRESMPVDIKTPYALSKSIGEEVCKLYTRIYKLNTSVVRYFNVYGKRQIETGKFATVIGIMLNEKRKGKPITIVGTGKQRRDFTHVSDIVEGTYKAMLYGKSGEVYNLGCGKNYSIKYLASLIQPNKKMHKSGYVRLQEAWNTQADITKARGDLGWNPRYSLKKGLKEMGAI
jgi:UDP-glucose 4-epimerase